MVRKAAAGRRSVGPLETEAPAEALGPRRLPRLKADADGILTYVSPCPVSPSARRFPLRLPRGSVVPVSRLLSQTGYAGSIKESFSECKS